MNNPWNEIDLNVYKAVLIYLGKKALASCGRCREFISQIDDL